MTDPFPDPIVRSGLADQIGYVLRHASIAVWNDVVATLGPLDLRPQTYAALLIVDAQPGCKQQDIADALGIQRPNLVALIDGLVARGLIDRSVNRDDRRSYALSLTAAGAALLTEARARHRDHEARIEAALGTLDRATVLDAVRRLAAL